MFKILCFFYGLVPLGKSGVLEYIGKFLRFFSYVTSNLLFRVKRKMVGMGILSYELDADGPIVTLTSFPARIDSLDLVLISILEQRCRASRIVLYLSSEQFDGLSSLPAGLRNLQRFGVEIEFVSGDLRSYKKFAYNQGFSDKGFIIIDDDILYPSEMLELLVNSSRSYPGHVVANRCMKVDASMPYASWALICGEGSAGRMLMPTGCGGVYYPSGSLPDFTFSIVDAMEVCPDGDDVWLKFCSQCNGWSTYYTGYSGLFIPIMNGYSGGLYIENVRGGQNDRNFFRASTWFQERHGFLLKLSSGE